MEQSMLRTMLRKLLQESPQVVKSGVTKCSVSSTNAAKYHQE